MQIAIDGRRLHAGRVGRLPAGDGDVALQPRDGEAPRAASSTAASAVQGMTAGRRRGALPAGRRLRQLRLRQEPRRRLRPDRLRVGLPQALLPGPVPRRADQRPADGLLPGGGAGQRREAPRGGGPARGRQRVRRTGRRPSGSAGPAGRSRAGRRRRRHDATRASRSRRAPGSPPGPGPSARRPASSRPRPRATAGPPESAVGWGVRLGLHLVKGIGEEHAERLDAELARGPYRSLADVVERTGPPRGGGRAADPGRGARLARPAAARAPLAAARGRPGRRRARRRAAGGSPAGRSTCGCRRRPRRTCRRSPSSSGWATPTRSSRSTRGARSSRSSGRRSTGWAR